MNYSHVDVFRLFKAPNKWTPEHLTGLHIEQNDHTRLVDIVDDFPQSKDDETGTYGHIQLFIEDAQNSQLLVFEALAKDFTQPTREQVPTASRGCRNPFWRAFVDLRNATKALNHGGSVQKELDGLASQFIQSSHSRDM